MQQEHRRSHNKELIHSLTFLKFAKKMALLFTKISENATTDIYMLIVKLEKDIKKPYKSKIFISLL